MTAPKVEDSRLAIRVVYPWKWFTKRRFSASFDQIRRAFEEAIVRENLPVTGLWEVDISFALKDGDTFKNDPYYEQEETVDANS